MRSCVEKFSDCFTWMNTSNLASNSLALICKSFGVRFIQLNFGNFSLHVSIKKYAVVIKTKSMSLQVSWWHWNTRDPLKFEWSYIIRNLQYWRLSWTKSVNSMTKSLILWNNQFHYLKQSLSLKWKDNNIKVIYFKKKWNFQKLLQIIGFSLITLEFNNLLFNGD